MDRLIKEVLDAASLKDNKVTYDNVAEAQGYAAYVEGWWECDNPYQAGTLNHRCWLDGWDRAWGDYAYEREKDERDVAEIRRYR